MRQIQNEKCKNVYYRFDFESTIRILKQVLQFRSTKLNGICVVMYNNSSVLTINAIFIKFYPCLFTCLP